MPDKQLTFPELLDGCGGSLSAIVMDSVQSQANRFEKVLLQAIDAGDIVLPNVVPGGQRPQGHVA